MGVVGALVVLWAACVVVMILVGAEWAFGNRGRNREEPVDGPASDGRAPRNRDQSP